MESATEGLPSDAESARGVRFIHADRCQCHQSGVISAHFGESVFYGPVEGGAERRIQLEGSLPEAGTKAPGRPPSPIHQRQAVVERDGRPDQTDDCS
jgi:hypothetical protein